MQGGPPGSGGGAGGGGPNGNLLVGNYPGHGGGSGSTPAKPQIGTLGGAGGVGGQGLNNVAGSVLSGDDVSLVWDTVDEWTLRPVHREACVPAVPLLTFVMCHESPPPVLAEADVPTAFLGRTSLGAPDV